MTRQPPDSNRDSAKRITPSQEKRLILAAKQRDERALSELYRLHVNAIYHYIYARVSDVETAEDITNDVFVRAIETLDRYDQRKAPFLGWLYHIAHGKVVDHYRRGKHRSGHLNIEDLDLPSTENPEQAASDRLYQEYVLDHLHQLSANHQQVLDLRFIQGHSVRATAKLIGKSEDAVRSLQLRALKALAELLNIDRGAGE